MSVNHISHISQYYDSFLFVIKFLICLNNECIFKLPQRATSSWSKLEKCIIIKNVKILKNFFILFISFPDITIEKVRDISRLLMNA